MFYNFDFLETRLCSLVSTQLKSTFSYKFICIETFFFAFKCFLLFSYLPKKKNYKNLYAWFFHSATYSLYNICLRFPVICCAGLPQNILHKLNGRNKKIIATKLQQQ